MKSDMMKARVAQFWRYDKQHVLVGFESDIYTGKADVVSVTAQGRIYETEVKISLSDLAADGHKDKHPQWLKEYRGECRPKEPYLRDYRDLFPHCFFFAVPDDLANKAFEYIDRHYPYAGLLRVSERPSYSGAYVYISRQPKILHTRKCSLMTLTHLVKDQSATLARLALKAAGIKETESELEQEGVK